MSKTDSKGNSVRAHLEQVAKSLGRTPKDLIGPEFPDRYGHLWAAFLDLHSGRSYGMGPNPISWPDILAWDTLTRSGLQEWEVRVIKALDALWLRMANEDSDG
jgi:hypothetical protein